MKTGPNTDFPDLTRETQEIWEQNGRWWDANMGEGNKWHTTLVAPATERLLAIQPGESVLELACGNGQFTRRLAHLGAHVVACDFSSSLLDCARLRSRDCPDRIEIQIGRSDQRRATRYSGHGRVRCSGMQHGPDGYCQHHAFAAYDSPRNQTPRSIRFFNPASVLQYQWNQFACRAGRLRTRRAAEFQRQDQALPKSNPGKGDWNCGTASAALLLSPPLERTASGLLRGRIRCGRAGGAGLRRRLPGLCCSLAELHRDSAYPGCQTPRGVVAALTVTHEPPVSRWSPIRTEVWRGVRRGAFSEWRVMRPEREQAARQIGCNFPERVWGRLPWSRRPSHPYPSST